MVHRIETSLCILSDRTFVEPLTSLETTLSLAGVNPLREQMTREAHRLAYDASKYRAIKLIEQYSEHHPATGQCWFFSFREQEQRKHSCICWREPQGNGSDVFTFADWKRNISAFAGASGSLREATPARDSCKDWRKPITQAIGIVNPILMKKIYAC